MRIHTKHIDTWERQTTLEWIRVLVERGVHLDTGSVVIVKHAIIDLMYNDDHIRSVQVAPYYFD